MLKPQIVEYDRVHNPNLPSFAPASVSQRQVENEKAISSMSYEKMLTLLPQPFPDIQKLVLIEIGFRASDVEGGNFPVAEIKTHQGVQKIVPLALGDNATLKIEATKTLVNLSADIALRETILKIPGILSIFSSLDFTSPTLNEELVQPSAMLLSNLSLAKKQITPLLQEDPAVIAVAVGYLRYQNTTCIKSALRFFNNVLDDEVICSYFCRYGGIVSLFKIVLTAFDRMLEGFSLNLIGKVGYFRENRVAMVFDNLGAKLLVNLLRVKQSLDMQTLILRAIAILCEDDDESQVAFLDQELVVALMDYVLLAGSPLQLQVLRLVAMLTRFDAGREQFQQRKGVHWLIQQLSTSTLDTLTYHCAILANTAHYFPVAEAFVESPYHLSMLCANTAPNNPEYLLANLFKALAVLSMHKSIREQIVKREATVKNITLCFGINSLKVTSQALFLSCNLALTARGRQLFFDDKAVPDFVNFLEHENTMIQYLALRTLCNLVLHDGILKIVKSGPLSEHIQHEKESMDWGPDLQRHGVSFRQYHRQLAAFLSLLEKLSAGQKISENEEDIEAITKELDAAYEAEIHQNPQLLSIIQQEKEQMLLMREAFGDDLNIDDETGLPGLPTPRGTLLGAPPAPPKDGTIRAPRKATWQAKTEDLNAWLADDDDVDIGRDHVSNLRGMFEARFGGDDHIERRSKIVSKKFKGGTKKAGKDDATSSSRVQSTRSVSSSPRGDAPPPTPPRIESVIISHGDVPPPTPPRIESVVITSTTFLFDAAVEEPEMIIGEPVNADSLIFSTMELLPAPEVLGLPPAPPPRPQSTASFVSPIFIP